MIYKSKLPFLYILFIVISYSLNAQVSHLKPYYESISIEELTKHVYYLSSDSLRGRELGDIGLDIAAEYISENFYSYDLDSFDTCNKYYQAIEFMNFNYGTSNVLIDSLSIFYKVFYCSKEIQDTVNTEIVFVGNATENDLKGLILTNKAIAILGTNLKKTYDKIKILNLKYGTKTFLIIFPTKSKSKSGNKELSMKSYNSFVDVLDQNFDLTDVNSKNDFTDVYQKYKSNFIHEFIKSENDIRIIIVPEFYRNFKTKKEYPYFGKSYKELRGLSTKNKSTEDNLLSGLKRYKLSYTVDSKTQIDTIFSNNVIGIVKGTEKQNEAIIITAHFDHIGRDKNNKVYAGADDNASGTAALMELAQSFALAERSGMKPKRTIVFMACTAEEYGLLGSRYYVENPLFSLNKTMLNINMDMIGRETLDSSIYLNSLYVLGKGNMSKKVLKTVKKYNKTFTELTIIDKPDKEDKYWKEQSDHYSFRQKKIPIVLFHTGVHDDLHKVSDRPEKIDYEKLTKITQLLFYTIWELANE